MVELGFDKNMFESMVENDVPSVYASAHGGHSNLKSKENYVSSKSASTKAINKILADNLSGENSSTFNDLFDAERTKAKINIENIKYRGKENKDPTGDPQAMPGQIPTLLLGGGQIRSHENQAQVQLNPAQIQTRPHPGGQVQTHLYHTPVGQVQTNLYRTPVGQVQTEAHHGGHAPTFHYPAPVQSQTHTGGQGQTPLYPAPALTNTGVGQVQIPFYPAPTQTLYGGQVQNPLYPAPTQTNQVQVPFHTQPHPGDQVQSYFYPAAVGRVQTHRLTSQVQGQMAGYPGQGQPGFAGPYQLIRQVTSYGAPHYGAPYYSGAPAPAAQPVCNFPLSQPGSGYLGFQTGNSALSPPLSASQPQVPSYQPQLQQFPIQNQSYQAQSYQAPSSSYQMSSPMSYSPILPATPPMVNFPHGIGNYPSGTPQPPHIIRTMVEQMEGDREGNYRVSKKEAELAYDGRI